MTPEETERTLLPRLARVVEVTLKRASGDAAAMKGALTAAQAWLEGHQLDGDFKAVPLDRATHWIEELEGKLGIAKR